MRVEHGRARVIRSASVVEGGVARNGTIRGSIVNGSAKADMRGRLGSDGFGSGSWVASGAVVSRGYRNAERRG